MLRKTMDHDVLIVNVRWLIRRDMPEVLAIEQASFEYAWAEEEFLYCLGRRNCIGMVATFSEQIVGFMVYELHEKTVRVLNFAVNPKFRRHRVGAQMAGRLKDKLNSQSRTEIVLEVRETNLAAQLFFKSVGFSAVGIRKEVYDDTPEDAYLMRYAKSGPVKNAGKFNGKNRIGEYL